LRKTYLDEKKKAIEARETVINKIEKRDKEYEDKTMEKS
jgi:ribosomal protein L9